MLPASRVIASDPAVPEQVIVSDAAVPKQVIASDAAAGLSKILKRALGC
jgi:hypothetical protein